MGCGDLGKPGRSSTFQGSPASLDAPNQALAPHSSRGPRGTPDALRGPQEVHGPRVQVLGNRRAAGGVGRGCGDDGAADDASKGAQGAQILASHAEAVVALLGADVAGTLRESYPGLGPEAGSVGPCTS
mmetsp:Transcript_28794/g.45163  ORF Transcript_28794/g.45163 Transcript_28794/m.45163 type:complete len:129 (+) Transcript_28794:850-1236(+)